MTFGARPLAAGVDWRPAVVELSDGTAIVGEVYIPQGVLRIYNEAQQRYYNVKLTAMKRLETVVEQEYMDKKWLWREDGRDEKVYTGEVYPVRKFRTRVTFHDDGVLEGHIIGRTLYVRSGGERQRLALVRKMEGKVGEELGDLVYVSSVTFPGEGTGVMGSLTGHVETPLDERLLGMRAINREAEFCIEGKVTGDGDFSFADCIEGTYDLVAITDRAIYLYFSREEAPGCSRLDAAMLEEIRQWAGKIKDVFEVQEPLYGAGNLQRAYVIVRLERTGPLAWSDPEKWAWVKLLRRYEVWLMHRPHDQWQIIKRYFITRELAGDPHDPREKLVLCRELGGHVIDAEHPDLTLTLTLAGTDEPLVPPPAEERIEDDDERAD